MCLSLDKFLVSYGRAVQVYFSGFDLVPVSWERMMNGLFYSNCCYIIKL